jgi:endonuclease YncB( thermonuclease family)
LLAFSAGSTFARTPPKPATRPAAGALGPSGALGSSGTAPVQRWVLPHPLLRVVDGDTLDVDLNGNGRLEPPEERLRLLYVDTPELHASPKGLDLAHGLPAKAALARLVAASPLEVQVFAGNERDRYGRALALLRAGDTWVNLELVRLGHSPLNTRFTFPSDYDAYVRAEAEAFTGRRGIWADRLSRDRYLARLRQEGRTPQAPDNPAWLPGRQTVAALDAAKAVGRYAIVAGVVRERRALRKGVVLIALGDAERTASARTLTVVVFPKMAERLGVLGWPVAARVRIEGFLAKYKGRIELQLHYARVGP